MLCSSKSSSKSRSKAYLIILEATPEKPNLLQDALELVLCSSKSSSNASSKATPDEPKPTAGCARTSAALDMLRLSPRGKRS